MTQQGFEFPAVRGKVRHTDPSSSQESAMGVKVLPQEEKILSVLRGHAEGLTAPEIAHHAGMPLNSVSTRMKRLLELGMVEYILIGYSEPSGTPYFLTRQPLILGTKHRKCLVYRSMSNE